MIFYRISRWTNDTAPKFRAKLSDAYSVAKHMDADRAEIRIERINIRFGRDELLDMLNGSVSQQINAPALQTWGLFFHLAPGRW